jgi:hypothetical protein
MPFSLWLRGRLIGETDFDHPGPGPGMRAGFFRPTEHGREILPLLSGMLPASYALKRAMIRRGYDPNSGNAAEMATMLESSDEGARVLAIGRELSHIEIHDPGGGCRPFRVIAISNLREIAAMAGDMGLPDQQHAMTSGLTQLEQRSHPERSAGSAVPPPEPVYLASVTFADDSPRTAKQGPIARHKPHWR